MVGKDGHNLGTRALVPEKEREHGMGRAQARVWAVQQTSAEGPRGVAVWPRTLDPYVVCRVHGTGHRGPPVPFVPLLHTLRLPPIPLGSACRVSGR